MNHKLFWFDTETDGLDFKRHDILQIAYIIEIDKKVEEEGNFYLQPFNYATIEKGALEVNHLELSQIKTFPPPQEIYRKLKAIIEKYVDRYDRNDKFSMAGYNVHFDVDMFREYFIKNNDKFFGSLFDYHVLDILPLLYMLEYNNIIKLENYKLVTACKYFGIPLDAHNALSDIRATRELFLKLSNYIKIN